MNKKMLLGGAIVMIILGLIFKDRVQVNCGMVLMWMAAATAVNRS